MARKRMLSPEFFTSETLAALGLEVERTFAGLWCYCDDEGRGKDSPALIKAAVWPLHDKVTSAKVDKWLDVLVRARKICRYTVGEQKALHVVNWSEHQKPSHPTPSTLAPCPPHELLQQNSESLASLSGASLEAFFPNVVGFNSTQGSSGDAALEVGAKYGNAS